MPNKNRPNIERCSPDEFKRLFPERLRVDQIDEQRLLSLLVRSYGNTFDAYKLTVKLKDIRHQLGGAAFKTYMLDADLNPASRGMNSLMDSNDKVQSVSMQITDKGRGVPIRDGFFTPPQPDEMDLFLIEAVTDEASNRTSIGA